MSEDTFIPGRLGAGLRQDLADQQATLPTGKHDAFVRRHVAEVEPKPSSDEMGALFEEAQDAMERLGRVLDLDLATSHPVRMLGALSYTFQLGELLQAWNRLAREVRDELNARGIDAEREMKGLLP